MDSTKEMLQHESSVIKQHLSTEIPEELFQTVNTDEMFRLDVFLGLETEHLREKLFQKVHFHYLISKMDYTIKNTFMTTLMLCYFVYTTMILK